MEPSAAIVREARCPRCGYDLRGVVATWAEACPLQSTCSECGLALEWSEVVGARARRPGWCVEFAPRGVGVPWRSSRTGEAAMSWRSDSGSGTVKGRMNQVSSQTSNAAPVSQSRRRRVMRRRRLGFKRSV